MADIEQPAEKRKRRAFSSTEKTMILNMYHSMSNADASASKGDILKAVASSLGVHWASVHRIVKEKNDSGELKSPKKLKQRLSIVDTIDNFTKCAIRNIVHNFFAQNEIPTLDKILKKISDDCTLGIIKRTTLHKILKKIGFKFCKRSRNSLLLDRDDTDRLIMTTKIETEYPSLPPIEESDGEEHALDFNYPEEEEEEEEDEKKDINNSNPLKTDVADLLARLQSSGALLKKPKQEYRCITCDLEFVDWEEQENHLIKHISLPSVILDKLPTDDEDLPPFGDENWSDEDEVPALVKQSATKTPQKIDISQILKKTGIILKKTVDSDKRSSDSALNKLSGLGFTIKKNSTPIKKEKPDDSEKTNDVMQKLGKLGGIKLKLKSDGNNTNSFKVVYGLKYFKASDDEDEGSGNEEDKDDADFDDDFDKSGENVGSEGEHDSDEHTNSNTRKSSDSNDSEKNKRVAPKLPKGIQSKLITPKKEPINTSKVSPVKNQTEEVSKPKPIVNKSAAKQVAKRGAAAKEPVTLYTGPLSRKRSQIERQSQATSDRQMRATPDRQAKATPDRQAKTIQDRQTKATAEKQRKVTPDRQIKTTPDRQIKTTSDRQIKTTPERQSQGSDRRESNEQIGNVVVKQELQDTLNSETHASVQELPLFSGAIKSERPTPPLSERSNPILAKVKSEPETQSSTANSEQYNCNSNNNTSATLLPVKKSEDTSVTVNEINGDSNDEDDDCCVVSTTPAPDIKPVVPKVENSAPSPYSITPSYSTTPSTYNSTAPVSSRLSTAPSNEKQHNFNWNAPDSKPPIDMLEKSADDIFESLLSPSTKKKKICQYQMQVNTFL